MWYFVGYLGREKAPNRWGRFLGLPQGRVALQGLSIMEAMASGLPVISADSMALHELVKDGVSGFLFEPGNASDASEKILQLATDRELRDTMSQNSLSLIKEHNFENILTKFERVYYENISGVSF